MTSSSRGWVLPHQEPVDKSMEFYFAQIISIALYIFFSDLGKSDIAILCKHIHNRIFPLVAKLFLIDIFEQLALQCNISIVVVFLSFSKCQRLVLSMIKFTVICSGFTVNTAC